MQVLCRALWADLLWRAQASAVLEMLEALSEARQGVERVHLIARELKVLSRAEGTE